MNKRTEAGNPELQIPGMYRLKANRNNYEL